MVVHSVLYLFSFLFSSAVGDLGPWRRHGIQLEQHGCIHCGYEEHFLHTRPPWITDKNQGIHYFATHRFLWPLFKARLIPIVLLSTFIYFILFFFTYLPQVAFLAIFQGAGAWVNGAFLVLGEGAVIVAALFEAFFVDETLVDIFDSVLVNEGQEQLVLASRVIYPEAGDPTSRLGTPTTSAVYAPFSLRQILEFIILLPLNFIPVAGTPMFLLLTGYRAGPFHHWRYFQLLDFTKQERKASVSRRQLQYTTYVLYCPVTSAYVCFI